jgi:hypothetical protein
MSKSTPLAKFGTSGPGQPLHEFFPRMEEHLEESFGPPVYSFRTGQSTAPQLPTRQAVRATLIADGLTGSALDKAEIATMIDHRKAHAKLLQEHALATGKAFAAVLNCLTPPGKESVRAHQDFPAARAADDLVALRAIISETHGATYGMSRARALVCGPWGAIRWG